MRNETKKQLYSLSLSLSSTYLSSEIAVAIPGFQFLQHVVLRVFGTHLRRFEIRKLLVREQCLQVSKSIRLDARSYARERRLVTSNLTNFSDRGIKAPGNAGSLARLVLEEDFNSIHRQRRRVRGSPIVYVVLRI